MVEKTKSKPAEKKRTYLTDEERIAKAEAALAATRKSIADKAAKKIQAAEALVATRDKVATAAVNRLEAAKRELENLQVKAAG